jgi:hypothetical protein
MFVELLDKLRCPHVHDDNALVTTTAVTHARYVIEGTLGCSICLAEYRVHRGAMEMPGDFPVPMLRPGTFSEENTIRRAAQLGLDERGGLYLVDGIGRYFIREFLEISPDSKFIALSVMDRVDDAVMTIRGRPDVLPLAAGCLRGAAFDFDASPALLRSAVKALAPGGRLVTDAGLKVPDGIEQLARDQDQWVGERIATPVLNEIRRATPGSA